jgi:hypothetical protein
MKSLATGICTAAALALSLTAFAQQPTPPSQPSQPPSAQQPPATQPKAESAAEQITLTGCVQSEEDYRKAKGMAKGGAVGTGAGVGNEFVIVMAKPAAGASGTPGAAGTSGAIDQAYEVTGSKEGDLKQFVGQRVEVSGKTKRAERSATGAPTGGVDPAGQDLKLTEIEIAAVKAAPGDCKPQ